MNANDCNPSSNSSNGRGVSACRVCGRKLSISQSIHGLCDAPECTRKDVGYQQQKRREWLLTHARKHIPEAWNSALTVALLPKNVRRLVPLPDSRIASHRRHLQSIVRDAKEYYRKNNELIPETDASSNGISEKEAGLPILSAACGLCGGECCYTGGNAAWLEAATIQRQAWFGHGIDDQRIVDFYLSYIPEISYEDGCIYQSETGCTLPRTMRSKVCNQFLCKSLAEMTNTLNKSGGLCAAATANGSQIFSISLIDVLGILETRESKTED